MIFDKVLFFLTSLFFFASVISNSFYWLYLWQVKEYRLDRLIIHFKETLQGRSLFLSFDNLFKLGLLFFYLFGLFGDRSLLAFRLLVAFAFFFSFYNFVRNLILKKVRFPVFTFKILTILLVSLSILFLLYVFPAAYKFSWLIILDRTFFFLVAGLFFLFSIPSDLYKDYIVYKAVQKRNKFKKLLVVGITGSYGKGSTKEFLSSILSSKFGVVKTFGTFNTPVGIAKTILLDLGKKTDIFVVEMGAYSMGEIAQMCSIVRPRIGIITAVNSQHASLFGDLKNTMAAKFELIESLPKNGLALFNGNNPNSQALAKNTKKGIVYFANYQHSKHEKSQDNFGIVASSVRVGKFNISFGVEITGRKLGVFKANLIGRQNIEALLPGIFLADYLGMEEPEIKKALAAIAPLKKTMEPYKSLGGTVYIDDTYNANPQAVEAGLEYMRVFNGKKALVLQPMIELGKYAKESHYSIGKKIGQVCDFVLLTNQNFFADLAKGVAESRRKCKIMIESPKKAAEFIRHNFGRDDVVVFEGKEAAFILDLLEKKTYNK